jgi:carbon storage regulator
VVKVDRNQVRLGIEAPAEVPVFRQEIAPARRPVESELCTIG